MDWLPQWLLLQVAFFALLIVAARVVRRARTRRVEELGQRLKAEASARGWQVTTEYTADGTQIIRWQGRDFDVQWIGEDLYRKRSQRGNQHITQVTRWRTVDGGAANGAIFLMALPEGTQLPSSQPVSGVLQSLIVKAAFFALDKSIDMYFGREIGKQIDASTLERVEQIEPLLNGYAVFAENPAAAANVLRNGVDEAIAAAIDSGPDSMRKELRPWILIWQRGVAVARMGSTRSASELEPLVRAGLAITRAIK